MIDFQDIISLPEGKTLEFKRDLSSIKPILKTLIAFANTAGGTLIIGVDDCKEIVGIKDIFEGEERLANAIADNIRPSLMPDIESTSIEGKSLLVVRVPHWRGPFFLKSKGIENGVYIRLGSTNRVAEPELLEELKRSISKISFDQLPCPGSDIQSLDQDRIREKFGQVNRKVDEAKLETLGVLVPYSGKLVCSNGGIILFGKSAIRERLFPNSFVRCARFRGTEKIDFIDQYDVEGTMLDAMDEVPKFIRRNTRVAARIEKMEREDVPEYSPIAVREVLTNAFVHADYSIQGMNPRIVIFSDRLEVESPGMLPFGYTLDDLRAGVSHVRNKVIARVFRELNLMEEWGTGYKRVVEACDKGGYPKPEWHEQGLAVRVVFEPHRLTQDEVEQRQSLLSRHEKIIDLLKKNDSLTAKEIFNHLAEEITERTLRNDLSELKEKGILKQIGLGPSTKWTLD
jgi:ATP-dependent DNA helicase RecG